MKEDFLGLMTYKLRGCVAPQDQIQRMFLYPPILKAGLDNVDVDSVIVPISLYA